MTKCSKPPEQPQKGINESHEFAPSLKRTQSSADTLGCIAFVKFGVEYCGMR
jgi:hypothetical protein